MINQMRFCLGGTRPMTGPIKAFWEVTHRCNSRCITCDMWKKKSPPEMQTQEALDVIRQLKDLNVLHVSISGGEPFLRKDIFEILDAAKREGFKISINTNAWLLDEEKVKRLCRMGIETTYISLDGATPETNEKIRGMKGGYERALEVVRFFDKHKQNNGSKVFINTTINRINVSELGDMAEVVSDSGADGWTMSVVQNVDIYRPAPEVLLTKDDIEQVNKVIVEVHRNHSRLLPHMIEYFQNFENSALHPCRLYRYRCVAGYLTLMIHPNGDIFPCPVAFVKAGNVLQKPLREIWYEDMQGIREQIKEGKHPICWFDCLAPMNLLMSYASPLRWYKLFNPKLIRHLIHKSV